ncbi:uncharacterized protein JN550_003035 [Neoarthrinium moseri]|uniref:uncharacterized protein n=1 Tax=Neoarthrinium moseri TaxID=1658444 RepID=UPI001FDC40F1|nr:uncharacterized protein JN550_003035 [Neoarthrinium moseri]KAI1873766.1 hypothetical protein JN550_003035 [Neoarthrinium moseri]
MNEVSVNQMQHNRFDHRSALVDCEINVKVSSAILFDVKAICISERSPNPTEVIDPESTTPWDSVDLTASTFDSVTSPLAFSGYPSFNQEQEQPDHAQERLISYAEVQKHTLADDCWVIIEGNIYDITSFLKIHPGGEQAILTEAGKDATEIFSKLHPSDALSTLPQEALIGAVDPTTLPAPEEKVLTEEEERRQAAREEMPDAHQMLLLQDFEYWAEQVLSDTAWSYYRSATDEERSFRENREAFSRYFFRPRILRDMSIGSTETSFLGIPVTMPIFIAPAAMAKLGHPLGEINLTKAAGEYGIVQAISANASCTLEELFNARKDGQPLVFQIYLNKDRSASASLLQKVERLGAKAIIFTVDTLGDSKRTMDVRGKLNATKGAPAPRTPLGVGAAISGYQARDMTWSDIDFIRSNHGGRQADYAPAPLDILYEMRALRPDLFLKTEVMIDGGIRSGADVVKALALGAKAVGLGRPFLYANGTHGQDGCSRVIEILHEEITNTMRNLGASTIQELKPEMVGPAGAWVGANRPLYAPAISGNSSHDQRSRL